MRIRTWLTVAFGATVSLVTGYLLAQAPAVELKAGDMAPAFSLPGSDGKTHSLAQHQGQRAVVLAWFPKAFTGG
jgi:peroxiredoxin